MRNSPWRTASNLLKGSSFWPALAVHCILLLAYFGGPSSLLSSAPLVQWDHAWHFYYSVLAGHNFASHFTFWGYEPSLMAGGPIDLMDTSDRLIKVLMGLLQFMRPELAYKLINFVLCALTPVFFHQCAKLIGFDRPARAIASFLGSWAWFAGGGLDFLGLGMVGFPFACVFALTFFGVFARHLDRPSTLTGLLLLLFGPLAILIHAGIAPVVCIPGAIFYLFRIRRVPLRVHLLIPLVCVVSIAANLFWMIPYVKNLEFAAGRPPLHFQNPLLILGVLYQVVFKRYQVIVLLLPVLAFMGLKELYQRPDRALFYSLAGAIAGTLLIALFGGALPVIHSIEPVRYQVPCLFFMVIPASLAVVSLARRAALEGRSAVRKAGLALLTVSAVSLAALAVEIFHPAPGPSFVGLTPKVAAIRDWIAGNTDRSARILLQDKGPLPDFYSNTFPSSIYAYYTGREIIGGPHWGSYLLNHFADISGVTMFGKRVDKWDEKQLTEAMDTYNIGWVGAFSPWWKELFDRFPGLFYPAGDVKGMKFYKVERNHDFFLEGSGRVDASFNRIGLSDVATDTGRVVISYHWHPMLKSEPPSELVRVMIGADPVGFIGVEHPPKSLVIEPDY